MAQARLYQKVLALKKETVRLTAEANAVGARFIPILPATEITPAPTILPNAKLFGDKLRRAHAKGPRSVGGTLELEPGTDKLGELLLSLFGKVVTDQPDVGNAPSVFRHIFTPSTGPLNPTHTAFFDRSTHQKKYAGITCSQMTINTPVDNRVAVSADVIGIKEEDGVVLSPSDAGNLNDLNFFEVDAKLAGVSNIDVRGSSVVLANSLSEKRGLSLSRDPSDLLAGMLLASGTVSLYFVDDVERDKFVESDPTKLRLLIVGEVLEDVQKATLDIELDGVRYNAGPIGDQDGQLVHDFSFEADKDSGGTDLQARVTLINKVSSY